MGRREASGRCGGGRVCLAAAPRSGNAKRSAAAGWSENGKSRGTVGCACTLGAPTHCTRWNSGRNGSGEQTSLFARGRMLRGPPGHDPLSPDPLVVAFLSHCCAAAVREKTWYHQVNREDSTHGTRRPTTPGCAEAWTPRRDARRCPRTRAATPILAQPWPSGRGLTQQRHCFQRATLQRRLSWSQPSATATAAAVNVGLGRPRAVKPRRPQALRRVTRPRPPPAAGRCGHVDKQEAWRLLVHSPGRRPCSYDCCFGYGCHAGRSSSSPTVWFQLSRPAVGGLALTGQQRHCHNLNATEPGRMMGRLL